MIILSNNDTNYEENLNNLFKHLKNELRTLLKIDISIFETHRCPSIFSLKEVLPISTTYLVNTIMAHIINNRFDKIAELRDSFFSSSTIEEQRNLCKQLTDSIKSNLPNDVEIKTINEISIHSVSNTSALVIYFNELINVFKSQNKDGYVGKEIILEAIRYIEAN